MSDFVLLPSEASSDWGSFIQRVMDEIHRERDLDADAIGLEICSAINFYRSHRFFFNEGNDFLYTVADQSEYEKESAIGTRNGYPTDLIRPDVLRLDRSSDNWVYPLERIPFHELRDRSSYVTVSGYPNIWSWHHDVLFIWPAPNTADWELEIDYIRDIGTPVYKYSGGEYSFYERDTGDVISNSWESEWFIYAEPLIRQRVKWGLYINMYHDMTLAAAMKDAEMIELKNLEGATDNYQWSPNVTPWGL